MSIQTLEITTGETKFRNKFYESKTHLLQINRLGEWILYSREDKTSFRTMDGSKDFGKMIDLFLEYTKNPKKELTTS